ncbi:MAG: DCC1-like thiol-disulfide oxidoreductase family protein [Gloeomargarita sp. HHBFW_bins_162]
MPQYLLIYDGLCNLCATCVQAVSNLDQGHLFTYLPMQDEAALAEWGITPDTCAQGMIVIDQTQPAHRWQGSEAVEQMARLIPGIAPLVDWYRGMTALKSLGDSCYAQIRDHRYEWFGQREQVYRVAVH